MKTRNLLFPVLLILIAVLFQSNISIDINSDINEGIDIPENVKSVLDNKCFGCHNVDGTSDKAKKKLLLDKLDDLSKAKQIATLGEIGEVVSEGAMPPEKFLEQKPEAKLSEDEQKVLIEWTEQASDDLLK
jgi:uncharacterized membrane protein